MGRGITDLAYNVLSPVPIEIRLHAEGTLLESDHRQLAKHGSK